MNRLGNAPTDALFGLIALHNDLIARTVFPAALRAQAHEPGRALAEILVAQKALTPGQRDLVESLFNERINRHGGDAEKSLAVLIETPSARERLDQLGDDELSRTLPPVASLQSTVPREAGGDLGYSTAPSQGGPRFRVLRPHAKGGLGEVFLALDAELNREVALKQMLDRPASDPVSRQRFLVEAEITGGLEHPGIVPVYGLGSYSDGRPYYAMRFIKGDNLKEAIKRFHGDVSQTNDQAARSLALRKLLRSFTDVCNAIDYAHSRGVLHRDIKPGNIIVGKYGETLVVDWGLAKPLGRVEPGQQSGERILVPSSASGSAETLPGTMMGTPAYMSPEQACGDLDRLGPTSDVYSLGATLYCLLTNRPPFQIEDILEVLGKVQNGEFVPPRSLDPSIDPALEAVCLKAMALKPEDRYATSRAMADDVERWLADEPVIAWREPLSRRARRWARQNRTTVVTLAASVLVALAGTGAVLAVQTQAKGRLQLANNNLSLANAREKQRFDLATEAIRLFHGEVGDDLVLKADQFKPLRDKLLQGALDFYGKLEGLLEGQPDKASRAAMADAYFELGELTSKIGDRPAALAAHRKGLAVRRELASKPGDAVEAGIPVAKSLDAAAYLLFQTGNSAEALARYEEARDLLEGLPHSGPGYNDSHALLGKIYGNLGRVLAKMGRTPAAMLAYQRSVDTLARLADESPSVTEFRGRLASTHHNIGRLQAETGKSGEALESLRRAVLIQQKLADDNPAATEFRRELCDTLNDIGNLQSDTGKPGEALGSFQRAVVIQQKLADQNPAVTNFRMGLGLNLFNIGLVQSNTGKAAEALESFQQALTIFQKLADENPSVSGFQHLLATSQSSIGWLLLQSGRAADSVARFSQEEAILTRLVQKNPATPDYRNALANCQTNTATALLIVGRPADARSLCAKAVRLRDGLVKEHPEALAYRTGLGESLLRSGLAHWDTGDAAAATADWGRADALLEGAAELDPQHIFFHACCHASLSRAAGLPGSGKPAGDSDIEAGKALSLLRRASAAGFRDVATYRNETALDPLRGRDEFRLLLMDLTFPAEPFAQ